MEMSRRRTGQCCRNRGLILLAAAAAFLLTGCFHADDLTARDYERADAVLAEEVQMSYEPVRKADGSPFRIAYVDIDPYPPSGEMFYRFVEELIRKGWIQTGEELPFSPLNTDAKEMIRYLSEHDTAGYLQFDLAVSYYLSVDGEEACRASLEKEVENKTVDLIFCMGTWPGKFVKDMGITDVPVMVYFSVDPVGAGIADSTEDSGQDNIWCHINYTVYNKQLQFYYDNFSFQNIGMVYYDESVAAMRAYREVAEEAGFHITEVKVDQFTGNEGEAEEDYYRNLKAVYESLVKEEHIDAFLLSTDILKDESRIPEMLRIFYQNHIPVFVQNGEYFVQQGALMMVTASDAKDQAPFVAETFAAILNGEPPRQMKQEYLSAPYLTINLDAAKALGYQVPYNLLLSSERLYQEKGD